jgi:hypothetical protein
MGLLFIGIAVGLVVAFLLRALVQYERQGLARVGDGLALLEEAVEALDERVRTLEAIEADDDTLPTGLRTPDMEPEKPTPERRAHA